MAVEKKLKILNFSANKIENLHIYVKHEPL